MPEDIKSILSNPEGYQTELLDRQLSYGFGQMSDQILSLREEKKYQNLKNGILGDLDGFSESLKQPNMENYLGATNKFEAEVRGKYFPLINELTDANHKKALTQALEIQLLSFKNNALRMDLDKEKKDLLSNLEAETQLFKQSLISKNKARILNSRASVVDALQGLKERKVITDSEYRLKVDELERLQKNQVTENLVQDSLSMEFTEGAIKTRQKLLDVLTDSEKKLTPEGRSLLYKRVKSLGNQVGQVSKEQSGFFRQVAKEQKDLSRIKESQYFSGEGSFESYKKTQVARIKTLTQSLRTAGTAGAKKAVLSELEEVRLNLTVDELFNYSPSDFTKIKKTDDKRKFLAFKDLTGNKDLKFEEYSAREQIYTAMQTLRGKELSQDEKVLVDKRIHYLSEKFNSWESPEDVAQFFEWKTKQGIKDKGQFSKKEEDNGLSAGQVVSKSYTEEQNRKYFEVISNQIQDLADMANTSDLYQEVNGASSGPVLSDKQQSKFIRSAVALLNEGNILGFADYLGFAQKHNLKIGALLEQEFSRGSGLNEIVRIMTNLKSPQVLRGVGVSLKHLTTKDSREYEEFFSGVKNAIEKEMKSNFLGFGGLDLSAMSLDKKAALMVLSHSIAGNVFNTPNYNSILESDDTFKRFLNTSWVRGVIDKNRYLSSQYVVDSSSYQGGFFEEWFGPVDRGESYTGLGEQGRLIKLSKNSNGFEHLFFLNSLHGRKGYFSSSKIAQVLYGMLSVHYSELGSARKIDLDSIENLHFRNGEIYVRGLQGNQLFNPLTVELDDGTRRSLRLNTNKLKELLEAKGFTNKRIIRAWKQWTMDPARNPNPILGLEHKMKEAQGGYEFSFDEAVSIFENIPRVYVGKIRRFWDAEVLAEHHMKGFEILNPFRNAWFNLFERVREDEPTF